jgi:hypothetical protein
MPHPLSINDVFPDQLLQALRVEAGLSDRDVAALLPFAGAFYGLAALHQARVFILLEIARPKDWTDRSSTGPYPNQRVSNYLREVRQAARCCRAHPQAVLLLAVPGSTGGEALSNRLP